jgi:hypothetical protein
VIPVPKALGHFLQGLLMIVIEHFAQAYVHLKPNPMRLEIHTIEHHPEDENQPTPPSSPTDPTFVAWLDQVYEDSPNE